MPDQRPSKLSTFLGKITRNLSLNRWELYNAGKRGSGQIPLALDELHECIPTSDCADQIVDDLALTEIFNRFLATLSKEKRMIFMRRYWYLSPIAEIAADHSISESKVKMSLLRSRNALKQVLAEEGIDLSSDLKNLLFPERMYDRTILLCWRALLLRNRKHSLMTGLQNRRLSTQPCRLVKWRSVNWRAQTSKPLPLL